MNNTYQPPLPVISSEQELTNAWVKIGKTHNMLGYTSLGLFVDLEINDSEGVQIKVIGKRTEEDTVEFKLPIFEVTVEGTVEYEGTHFVLSDNENQSLIIKTTTDNLIPFVDIYMKVETVGTTPAKLKSFDVSKSWAMGGQ